MNSFDILIIIADNEKNIPADLKQYKIQPEAGSTPGLLRWGMGRVIGKSRIFAFAVPKALMQERFAKPASISRSLIHYLSSLGFDNPNVLASVLSLFPSVEHDILETKSTQQWIYFAKLLGLDPVGLKKSGIQFNEFNNKLSQWVNYKQGMIFSELAHNLRQFGSEKINLLANSLRKMLKRARIALLEKLKFSYQDFSTAGISEQLFLNEIASKINKYLFAGAPLIEEPFEEQLRKLGVHIGVVPEQAERPYLPAKGKILNIPIELHMPFMDAATQLYSLSQEGQQVYMQSKILTPGPVQRRPDAVEIYQSTIFGYSPYILKLSDKKENKIYTWMIPTITPSSKITIESRVTSILGDFVAYEPELFFVEREGMAPEHLELESIQPEHPVSPVQVAPEGKPVPMVPQAEMLRILQEALKTVQPEYMQAAMSTPAARKPIVRPVPIYPKLTAINLSFGIDSQQGMRSTMEDTHIHALSPNKRFEFFAVYDGHGGPQTAWALAGKLSGSRPLHQFIFDSLAAAPLATETDIANILKGAVKAFDDSIRDRPEIGNSGSTAIAALIDKQTSTLYFINLGDARSIVINKQGRLSNLSYFENGSFTGNFDATQDHKPSKDEAAINAAGHRVTVQSVTTIYGTVEVSRIDGKLAVSRAFGDFSYKDNPLMKDHMTNADIYMEKLTTNDCCILLACDGLWDVKTSQDMAKFLFNQKNENQTPEQAAKTIGENAVGPWNSQDNVTNIVIYLK